MPVPDLSYFVVAVMIQRESGGNLAELLDNIATIVRERLKLLGEVRTLVGGRPPVGLHPDCAALRRRR